MKITFFGKGVVKLLATGEKLFKFVDGEYTVESKEFSEKIINKLKRRFEYKEIKPRKRNTNKKQEVKTDG